MPAVGRPDRRGQDGTLEEPGAEAGGGGRPQGGLELGDELGDLSVRGDDRRPRAHRPFVGLDRHARHLGHDRTHVPDGEGDARRPRPLPQHAQQEGGVDLRVLGRPVGPGEAREVEARLEHVVVEELAREAVVPQHVLALRELLGLRADRGEEEAAARRVAAVASRLVEEGAQAQVVLAARRPDEAGLGPADRPGHPGVGLAGAEEGEAQAAGALLRGGPAEDSDPRPAAGELERGGEGREPGAHHCHVHVDRTTEDRGEPHA
jgi:hypothetical protein